MVSFFSQLQLFLFLKFFTVTAVVVDAVSVVVAAVAIAVAAVVFDTYSRFG